MGKKPKISAEVTDAEFESYKQAASKAGKNLSEWIRLKLNMDVPSPTSTPEVPIPPPPPPPVETPPTPGPLTEPAPVAVVVTAPLPKNPLPAQVAASVSEADKRRMLFESPNALPPYRPPDGKEGPAAKPLVASHPVTLPPPMVTAPTVAAPNGKVVEAMRVAEHPCVHLRPGTPGNLRTGECHGICGHQRQQGKPCFWAASSARSCQLFNPKVAQVMFDGSKSPTFPRR